MVHANHPHPPAARRCSCDRDDAAGRPRALTAADWSHADDERRTPVTGTLMDDVFDRQRTAALIEEARQITAELKVETEKIKLEMTRVLEGHDVDFLDVAAGEKVAGDCDFSEGERVPKSFWRFWR